MFLSLIQSSVSHSHDKNLGSGHSSFSNLSIFTIVYDSDDSHFSSSFFYTENSNNHGVFNYYTVYLLNMLCMFGLYFLVLVHGLNSSDTTRTPRLSALQSGSLGQLLLLRILTTCPVAATLWCWCGSGDSR